MSNEEETCENDMMRLKLGNIVTWSSLQIKQVHINYRKKTSKLRC